MNTGTLASLLQSAYPGRTDCYLDEKRRCVHEPLTPAIIEQHLRGEIRIGSYPNGTAWGLAFDFDGKNLAGGADEAWQQLIPVNVVLEMDCGFDCFVPEVTRSGTGYHLTGFYDPDDAPTLEENKRFGKLVLRVAGLPDDEKEKLGHPGVYPHPPGRENVGKTVFMPWSGLVNGSTMPDKCVFVSIVDRSPVEDQESVLQNIRRITRQQVLTATAKLTTMLPETVSTTAPPEHGEQDSTTKYDLRNPPERHGALIREAGRLRNLVPLDEATVLLEALADSYGLTAEGRGREVEDAVRHAYDKPAKFVRTQFDKEKRGAVDIDVVSMADLLATPIQPYRFVVSGLAARGKCTMLAGTRKFGKSKLFNSIVLDVAAERVYALEHDAFPILNPGPVLWVDFEQGTEELNIMSHRLITGNEYDGTERKRIKERIHWVPRQQLDLKDPGTLAKLHQAAESRGAVMVVVDSISAVQPFYGGENENTARRKMYNDFIAPFLDIGCAFVGFGHTAIATKDSAPDTEMRTRGGGDILGTGDLNAYIIGRRHEREHGDQGRVLKTFGILGALESRGTDFDKCRYTMDGPAPMHDEIPGPLHIYAEPVLRGASDADVRDVNNLADAIVASLADGPRFTRDVGVALDADTRSREWRDAINLAKVDCRIQQRAATEEEKQQYREAHPAGGRTPGVLERIEDEICAR